VLTSNEIATIRSWIGDKTPPTDVDLDPIHARTGSLRGVVVEVLRKRLATMSAKPSQFAVAGDYSQTTAENIRSLERQLAQLQYYTDDLVYVGPSDGDAPLTGAPIQIIRRGARR
jgi:hypothetical protein